MLDRVVLVGQLPHASRCSGGQFCASCITFLLVTAGMPHPLFDAQKTVENITTPKKVSMYFEYFNIFLNGKNYSNNNKPHNTPKHLSIFSCKKTY